MRYLYCIDELYSLPHPTGQGYGRWTSICACIFMLYSPHFSWYGTCYWKITEILTFLVGMYTEFRYWNSESTDRDVLELRIRDPFHRLLLHGVCEVILFLANIKKNAHQLWISSQLSLFWFGVKTWTSKQRSILVVMQTNNIITESCSFAWKCIICWDFFFFFYTVLQLRLRYSDGRKWNGGFEGDNDKEEEKGFSSAPKYHSFPLPENVQGRKLVTARGWGRDVTVHI